ncbi:hypothetical protein NE865_01299 [Phthorimaea operculella]|nr:hypothetical protein NE865_01299 [Phthorimaea operculella]
MEVRILIVIVALVNFVTALENDISSTQEAQVESEFQTSTTSEATEPLSNINFDIAPSPIERSGHAHVHVDPTFKGFWKKKFAWQPRWVKTWQEKKVYVAVWKRMWGPVVVKEWVPVPRPPPGWTKGDAGSYIVTKPYH